MAAQGKSKREYHQKMAGEVEHGGKDRHSGISGGKSGKKGCAGGKGTWGKPGVDDLKYADERFDDGDEDYEGDSSFIIEARTFEDEIDSVLNDFFLGGSIDDASRAIKDRISPELHPRFVKKALHKSFDLRAYERELTSKLLSEIVGITITRDAAMDGFQRSIDDLPETVIDVPHAIEFLGKFLARANFDEVLPPVFLEKVEVNTKSAKECLLVAKGALKELSYGPRLAHVWGPGDLASAKRMIKECSAFLTEFLVSGDSEEATVCLQKLNAPSFHPRFVRELLRIGLEKGEDAYDRMLNLLKKFCDMGLVSQYNIGKGFQLVHARRIDLKLDYPKIEELLPVYFDKARKLQLLPEKSE